MDVCIHKIIVYSIKQTSHNHTHTHTGLESNFEIVSRAFVTTQGVPYDIRSLMHYGAHAFSRNGQPTIEPIDRSISLNQLGQRSGFSSSDLQHVNTLYCSDCKCRIPYGHTPHFTFNVRHALHLSVFCLVEYVHLTP